MKQKPFCFVLMPFGVKPDPTGSADINFDRVYEESIEPGIKAAGMMAIRADEEQTGGIIHKPMFERLLLCEFAIADLTTANPNVFYELGVRHTARPSTTLTIFAKHQPIPFDLTYLRALPYSLGSKNKFGKKESASLKGIITKRLKELRHLAIKQNPVDSPLFQLLSEWKPGNIARLKTDVFRDQVQLHHTMKKRLAEIRDLGQAKNGIKKASEALRKIQKDLYPMDRIETGVLIRK